MLGLERAHISLSQPTTIPPPFTRSFAASVGLHNYNDKYIWKLNSYSNTNKCIVINEQIRSHSTTSTVYRMCDSFDFHFPDGWIKQKSRQRAIC